MPPPTKKSIPYCIVIFCLWVIGLAVLSGLLWQPSFTEGIIFIPFFDGHLGFYFWEFLPPFISLLLFAYYLIKSVKSSYRNKYFILFVLFGIAAIIGIFLLPFRWSVTYASDTYMDTESNSKMFFVIVYTLMASIILAMLFLLYQRYQLLRNVNKPTTSS